MTLRWIQRALCALGMLTIGWPAAAADAVSIHYAWVDAERTLALMAVRVNDGEPEFGFLGTAPGEGRTAVQFEIRALKTLWPDIDAPTLLRNLRENKASPLYAASLNTGTTAPIVAKPAIAALKSLHDALQSRERASAATRGDVPLAVWTWSSDVGGPLRVALAGSLAFVQRSGSRSDEAERIEAALVAFVERWQAPHAVKANTCAALVAEADSVARTPLSGEKSVDARRQFASRSASPRPRVKTLGPVVTIVNEGLVPATLALQVDLPGESGVELVSGSEGTPVKVGAPIEVPVCGSTEIVARAATDGLLARLKEIKEGELEAELQGQTLRIFGVPPVGFSATSAILGAALVVALAAGGGLLWSSSRNRGVVIKVERSPSRWRQWLLGTPTSPRNTEQPGSGKRGSPQETTSDSDPVVKQRLANFTQDETRGRDFKPVPAAATSSSFATSPSVSGSPVQALIDSFKGALPTLEQLSRNPSLFDTAKTLERWENAFKDWSSATPGEVSEALRDVLRVANEIRDSTLTDQVGGPQYALSPNAIIDQSGLGAAGATGRIRAVGQTLKELVAARGRAAEESKRIAQRFETFTSQLSTEMQAGGQSTLAPELLTEDIAALRRLAEDVIATYAPLKAGADTVADGPRVLKNLDQRWRRVRSIPDRVRAYESDPRLHLVLVALDTLDASGRELPAVASSAKADLLADADLDLQKLSGRLSNLAASMKEQIRVDIFEKAAARSTANEPERREDIDACLVAMFRRLLRGGDASDLTRMLRLWQVMEAYWRDVNDPDVANMYGSGAAYRSNCEFFQSVLAHLGVRFHPIRFLQRLPSTTDGSSPWHWELQKTAAPIRESRSAERQRQNVSAYDGTIADVTQWGLECTFAPELSSKSNIYLWNV